jgi:hypothetical protein
MNVLIVSYRRRVSSSQRSRGGHQMTMLLHIADRVLNRPLMILPEKLTLIASVLDGRIGIDAKGFEDIEADYLKSAGYVALCRQLRPERPEQSGGRKEAVPHNGGRRRDYRRRRLAG